MAQKGDKQFFKVVPLNKLHHSIYYHYSSVYHIICEGLIDNMFPVSI